MQRLQCPDGKEQMHRSVFILVLICKSSLRVFVVGEQVVENPQGGLEVQVDNICKTE